MVDSENETADPLAGLDLITRLAPNGVVCFFAEKAEDPEGANHVDYRL
jgi:hypothetical protein